MPGRSYTSQSYRYGFNGQEKDDEIKGSGNHINYGFRAYDPRLARFLSVDPLTTSYPELTPYQFASLTPIWASDLDGLEANYETTTNDDGSTLITITIDLKVKNSSSQAQSVTLGQSFEIATQIEKSFSGYDPETNTYYVTKVHLDFESPINEETDFYIEFVDKIDAFNPITKQREVANGWTSDNGNTNSNRFQILSIGESPSFVHPEVTPKSQIRTGAHEIGHGLGLKSQVGTTDFAPEGIEVNKNNLMRHSVGTEEAKGFEITPQQLQKSIKTIDENN